MRVWSLADLRPCAVRRLHPVTSGVLGLRLVARGGQTLLVSQGRDGAVLVWPCGPELALPEAPARAFGHGLYSFCRFSTLAPPAPASAAVQEAEEAAAFAAGAVGDAAQSAEPPPASPRAAHRAAVAALHVCDADSAGEAPALLALPGDAEDRAEVRCLSCGAALAALDGARAADKSGLLMALRLFEARGRVLLAAGYEAGTVLVWDLGGGFAAPRVLAQGKLHAEPVMALDVDADGGGGVSSSAEDRVVSFTIDYESGVISEARALTARGEGVGDVALRPDGALVAAAGWDGRVRLFRRASGRALAVLKYHRAAATAAAFGPRSYRLATGARDGTVALWDCYARGA